MNRAGKLFGDDSSLPGRICSPTSVTMLFTISDDRPRPFLLPDELLPSGALLRLDGRRGIACFEELALPLLAARSGESGVELPDISRIDGLLDPFILLMTSLATCLASAWRFGIEMGG